MNNAVKEKTFSAICIVPVKDNLHFRESIYKEINGNIDNIIKIECVAKDNNTESIVPGSIFEIPPPIFPISKVVIEVLPPRLQLRLYRK